MPNLSYFVDGATGGVIVLLQSALFLMAFLFAPKHGLIATRSQAQQRLQEYDQP